MSATFPRTRSTLALFAVAPIAAAALVACESAPKRADVDAAAAATPARAFADRMDGYYLSTCATCGGLLGSKGEAVDVVRDGRKLRFCGHTCARIFESSPAQVLARVDAAMIADQLPHYPLTTSLVSGKPLGTQRVDFVWGNRLFRAADAAKRDTIVVDAATFIARLDKAVVAAQTPTYAMLTKCPVQGDILPGDPVIDMVVANRMVRVCCGTCVRVVKARPYQYLAMVDYANREAAARRSLELDEGSP